MTTINIRRAGLVLATFDAVLMFGVSSAMAAPASGLSAATLHLPSVILAGIGLLALNLTHWTRG